MFLIEFTLIHNFLNDIVLDLLIFVTIENYHFSMVESHPPYIPTRVKIQTKIAGVRIDLSNKTNMQRILENSIMGLLVTS